MANQIINVNGNISIGITNEWPSGTSHWLCVKDLTKTDYSWKVMTTLYQTWETDYYSIEAVPPGKFDYVRIQVWGGQTYGYHVGKALLKKNGDTWESGEFGWSAASYEPPRQYNPTTGIELLTNPLTGLDWTRDDFVDLQLGVSLNEKGSFGYIGVSWLYLELVNFMAPRFGNIADPLIKNNFL